MTIRNKMRTATWVAFAALISSSTALAREYVVMCAATGDAPQAILTMKELPRTLPSPYEKSCRAVDVTGDTTKYLTKMRENALPPSAEILDAFLALAVSKDDAKAVALKAKLDEINLKYPMP